MSTLQSSPSLISRETNLVQGDHSANSSLVRKRSTEIIQSRSSKDTKRNRQRFLYLDRSRNAAAGQHYACRKRKFNT